MYPFEVEVEEDYEYGDCTPLKHIADIAELLARPQGLLGVGEL
jgi:hypothetical protein